MHIGIQYVTLTASNECYVDLCFKQEVDYALICSDIRDASNYIDNIQTTWDNIVSIGKCLTNRGQSNESLINFLTNGVISSVEDCYHSMESIGEAIGKAIKSIWDLIKRFFSWIWDCIKRLFGIKSKIKCQSGSGLANAAKKNPKVAAIVQVVDSKNTDAIEKQKVSPATIAEVAKIAPKLPSEFNGVIVSASKVRQILQKVSEFLNNDSEGSTLHIANSSNGASYTESVKLNSAAEISKKQAEYKSLLSDIASTKSKLEDAIKKAEALSNTDAKKAKNKVIRIKGLIGFLSSIAGAINKAIDSMSKKVVAKLKTTSKSGENERRFTLADAEWLDKYGWD